MASSGPASGAPDGAQGQNNFSTDQTFDRKTKTLLYIFSPYATDADYRSNCIEAESSIAAAINSVDEELFSQLTDDNNGSELKFCTFLNKSKVDGTPRLFSKFELYSTRAVKLFRAAFPPNRWRSSPSSPGGAAAAPRQFYYSWPGERRVPRARRPQPMLMALAIRGGQKISRDTLASALNSVGVVLCSILPIRGHGLKAINLADSLAIVRCTTLPKTITVGEKVVPLHYIQPVSPDDAITIPTRASYAAAVSDGAAGTSSRSSSTDATPAYAIQAWHAIEAAKSMEPPTTNRARTAQGEQVPRDRANDGDVVMGGEQERATTGHVEKSAEEEDKVADADDPNEDNESSIANDQVAGGGDGDTVANAAATGGGAATTVALGEDQEDDQHNCRVEEEVENEAEDNAGAEIDEEKEDAQHRADKRSPEQEDNSKAEEEADGESNDVEDSAKTAAAEDDITVASAKKKQQNLEIMEARTVAKVTASPPSAIFSPGKRKTRSSGKEASPVSAERPKKSPRKMLAALRDRAPTAAGPASPTIRSKTVQQLFDAVSPVKMVENRRFSNSNATRTDDNRHQRGLCIVSHNVRGLSTTKLSQLLPLWEKLHANVLFIQEHHRNILETPPLNNLLGSRPAGTGWKPFWRFNETGASSSTRGSAGVAIFIRSRLLRDGAINIDGGGATAEAAVKSWAPANQEDGRSISLNISWAGHKLMLACVYLPNHAVDRAEFIRTRIIPMKKFAVAKGRQLILGGDFNFVHNPSLDRLTVSGGIVTHPTAQSETTAIFWCSHPEMEALVDVWRVQHPTSRYLSWMQNGSAARLDRFYTDMEISTYIRCPSKLPQKALGRALYRSDHAPVVCCLYGKTRPAGMTPPPSSRRTPRLNVSFMKTKDLIDKFADWLEAKLEAMPATDSARIRWWTKFKNKTLRWKIYNLNGEYFRMCDKKVALDKLLEELGGILTALNGSDAEARSMAAARYPALKTELATAEAELEAYMHNKELRAWIHHKERPSRALSYALLQRKREDIAALQDDGGEVHTSRSKCTDMAMKFWADISSQPATNAEARSQVLAALAADSLPKPEEVVVQQLGTQTITVDEMLQTLKKCSPHTTPGPDGIPMKLYKRFKTQFAPMLAAVFSAMGRLETTPRHFLDSIISNIFKKGSRLKIGDHRPISLTNTEYRLLARALAGRLGGVLNGIIDPAQTAFLRGRNIGDNVMLLQFLPAWLNQQGKTGLVAFCDFRKAYDTIDRQFLFEVAEIIGLGDGFLKWMKLLLTNTRSATFIDGYLSDFRKMEAGVRQGCPLAPLLYLPVAQAALSWLKSRDIGIMVESFRLTAAQFADDLKALLEIHQVPIFVAAMEVFALASGQHMLPAKTKILPIGKQPDTPLPEAIHDLPVVSSVKALGLTFSAFTGSISVDWPDMIKKVQKRAHKITKCKLSPFGRAFAMNGYALSRLLFVAQFVGLPEGTNLENLSKLVAAAVDSATCLRLPGETGPSQVHFTHVRKELLVGHPRRGGMGLMDLKDQVTAMQAKWGCRFLSGSVDNPWIRLGRAVLSAIIMRTDNSYRDTPYCTPRLHFLCAIQAGLDDYFCPRNGHVPTCLKNMATALKQLPRPKILAYMLPGPWCSNIPLWSNPLLQDWYGVPLERTVSTPVGRPEDSGYQIQKLNGRRIATLGDLLNARLEVESLSSTQYENSWHGLQYPGRPVGYPLDTLPHGIFRSRRNKEAVAALLDVAIGEIAEILPDGWIDAAQHPGSASIADTEDLIISSMGWSLHNRKQLLPAFSVKLGRLLQLLPPREQPHLPKIQAFAALISSDTPVQAVKRMLSRIWSLPCDGHALAPLWHLVLNGIPSAERMDSLAATPCGCQTVVGPTRVHLYHECPILRPLLQSIQKQFQGEWASPPVSLQRHHLWLAIKPQKEIYQPIWDIVVVYFIKACDSARRNWTDRALKAQNRRGLPRTSPRAAGSRHRPAMTPGPEMVSAVSAIALTEFWGGLAEFIAIQTLPSQWLPKLPLDHPFIHPDPEKRTWVLSRLE